MQDTNIRFPEGTNAIANASSFLHGPRRLTDGSDLQVTAADSSVDLCSMEAFESVFSWLECTRS